MGVDEYLERLLEAHEAYFDVSREVQFAGRTFVGYAEFHSEASQYVLVKRAKLWSAHTHEYIFFLGFERLTASDVEDLVSFATTDALAKVVPEPDHMTSYITLLIVAESVDDDAAKAVRSAKFRKNLKFGLQGWIDLRIAAIDLSDWRIITNRRGSELVATLERVGKEG